MSTAVFIAFVVASLSPDIVDVLYVALGICSPYGLYSHTVWAVAIEAALAGGLAYLATGSRSIAVSFGAVVVLHIAGDYFTGRKLLVPGGEMVGLQVYEYPAWDFALETFVVISGWWLLRRSAREPRWATSVWLLLLTLCTQAAFDLTVPGMGRSAKPTACARASAAPAKATSLVRRLTRVWLG